MLFGFHIMLDSTQVFPNVTARIKFSPGPKKLFSLLWPLYSSYSCPAFLQHNWLMNTDLFIFFSSHRMGIDGHQTWELIHSKSRPSQCPPGNSVCRSVILTRNRLCWSTPEWKTFLYWFWLLYKLDTPHCSHSHGAAQIEAAGTRTSVLQKLTQPVPIWCWVGASK